MQEKDQVMNFISSGIKGLAKNDKELNEEQRSVVVKAIKDEEPKDEEPACEVGGILRRVASEIDLKCGAQLVKWHKEGNSKKIEEFYQGAVREVLSDDNQNHTSGDHATEHHGSKGYLSAGQIMVIAVFGYKIIQPILKAANYVYSSVVWFIKKIINLIYDTLEKFGATRWITSMWYGSNAIEC